MSTWNFGLVDVALPTNATDSLANIKSIFELPAPANQPLKVTAIDIMFDGLPNTTNKPVLIQLILATATGTFPSNTVTPTPVNVDSAAASSLVTAANVKFGAATGEGTLASGNGKVYRFVPTAGVLYQLPLGREIWIPKGAFFRIRAVAVNAVNATFNVEEDE